MKGNGRGPAAVTLIYYHVPTDQDEAQFPNAFPLPKPSSEIRLRDVREKFPLPGVYHFRFKLKWSDNTSVWMDVTNEDSVVPKFDEKIICKVLRVSWSGSGVPAAENPRSQSKQLGANTKHPPPTQLLDSLEKTKTPPGQKKPAAATHADLLFGENSPKNSKQASTTDLLFDGFTSAPPPRKDDFDLF
ncbi:unnamed protein product [Amoebophrya sp. A120]|nr:unnamed protein product [Amoebophrya sp. A120]|eukprot:GSA120T00006251001.1